tara:strand:- start:4200 stop:5339 length:1140 start_codon:yes stop_codon:yes gene_type:complete
MNHTTWIEINRSNLEHNVAQYQQWISSTIAVAPVIKANAYGHGLYEIASIYESNTTVKRLCVIDSKEALLLRQHNIQKPILILGYIDSPLEMIAKHNIDVTVYDLQTIKYLNQAAIKADRIINVHLKVDTGMSRLGIFPEEVATYIQYIKKLEGINLQGIWTHLSSGNDANSVHEQEQLFQQLEFPQHLQTHISNSHGSMHIAHTYSFARVGCGLYGYLLTKNKEKQQSLKPVLSLKSKVIHIKHLPAKKHIGYQQLFTTSQPTTIAILGIGYYEGINSKLIHGGRVIINGHYAPIISINMNLTTIDITNIPQCVVGDIAIFLGQDNTLSITGYDWQQILNLNLRESFAKLESSIPRFIINTHNKQNIQIKHTSEQNSM